MTCAGNLPEPIGGFLRAGRGAGTVAQYNSRAKHNCRLFYADYLRIRTGNALGTISFDALESHEVNVPRLLQVPEVITCFRF